MKVTYRGHTQARECPDCESSHIGIVPCGRTFVQRLRSVRLDPSATPTRDRVAYYDDEDMKDLFGYDRKERRELYMDDTKGMGSLVGDDYTPEHVDAVLGKEDDS